MNIFANAWNHPRTSAAGILIAIVTVAQVLAQQGLNFGKVGSGTVVTLAGAVATAILGLLSRDPANPSLAPVPGSTEKPKLSSSAKLGVWALIALLIPLPLATGCSGVSVAQNIVDWTPALQSAVATVDSTAALLAPSDAAIFAAATVGFDAASNLLVNQAKAYLANPSASTLAQIQSQVTAFRQQVNLALLQAIRIVSPASQQHALAALQGVATIAETLLALVQTISSKAAVAQMAAASTIKLAAVLPYLDPSCSARLVAEHYAEPLAVAEIQIAQAQRVEAQSGF